MVYAYDRRRKPTLQEIARALGGEISGDQALAPGPGHSPRDRSLCVKLSGEDPSGFIVHSFAGDDPIECKDYVRARLGLPEWEPRVVGMDRVVAEFIYKDARGQNYLKVQKTANKNFWQQHWTGSGWRNGAPDGPRIPYRLPDLLADVRKPVYLVEGEKDADRLASLGFLATTTSGGSNGRWTPELIEHFRGRTGLHRSRQR
jgi:hypothetical protein